MRTNPLQAYLPLNNNARMRLLSSFLPGLMQRKFVRISEEVFSGPISYPPQSHAPMKNASTFFQNGGIFQEFSNMFPRKKKFHKYSNKSH